MILKDLMAPCNINYDNTSVCKICCKDLNIKEIHVGQTTDFIRRESSHKICCLNEKTCGYNRRVYKFIRENGGWENWDMVLIEKCKCENKLYALKKEREYIEQLEATLNSPVQLKSNHTIPVHIQQKDIQDSNTMLYENIKIFNITDNNGNPIYYGYTKSMLSTKLAEMKYLYKLDKVCNRFKSVSDKYGIDNLKIGLVDVISLNDIDELNEIIKDLTQNNINN